jgi:hypothetical protein
MAIFKKCTNITPPVGGLVMLVQPLFFPQALQRKMGPAQAPPPWEPGTCTVACDHDGIANLPMSQGFRRHGDT